MPTLATGKASWNPWWRARIIPRCFSCRCICTARPGSLIEHLIEPYTAALFSSSTGLRRDPAFLFNGQCILVLREAYEFVGGHAAVLKHLTEDLHLAKLAERHRMGIAVARAESLGSVRNYTGWNAAWRGIERKAFRLVHMPPGISLTILLTALCAALWLPLAAWLWFAGHHIAPLAVVLLMLLQLRPWYGNRPHLLLAPVAVYAVLPLILHGLFAAFMKKQTEWKGRRIKAA